MYISENTIDDVMRRIIGKLLKSRAHVTATRGPNREIFGALLQVNKPRARISRTEKKSTLFSCLGELLWYLAKSDDLAFINYYVPRYQKDSDDNVTIHGAYGPRLFMMGGEFNQIQNILRLLESRPQSRQAVIQLFDAADIARNHKSVPCTCTLQFAIRRERLYMLTSMRSNDAFVGLPHDVFAFTMIQEILARKLNLSMGTYKHVVGSIHLYEEHVDDARAYYDEAWQSTVSMPPMPTGDPWPSIELLLRVERDLRAGLTIDPTKLGLDPYWEDLARLLQIYRHFRNDEREKIAPIRDQMKSRVYDPYIERKIVTAPKPTKELPAPQQLPLFNTSLRT